MEKALSVNKKIKKRKMEFAPYIFISPFYISFIVFLAFPVAYSLFLSFQRWNGVKTMKFVFLKNYIYLFTDPEFYHSLLNTTIMLIMALIIQHCLALFFAFILNQGFVRLKDFFKGVMFIPYTTSTVAIALIFGVLYGTQYGLLNFGIEKLNSISFFNINLPIFWLKGPLTWFSIVFLATWKWVGWNTILYIAGLQSVPTTVYEAAKVDGANWLQIFFKITIPILRPIIYLATSATVIFGMQMFDEPVVLLRGESGLAETGNYGLTTAFYIYRSAFSYAKFGVAAAASYLLVLVILVLSGLNKMIWGEKKEAL
ncbi:MAG: sugar ABC transporter permease [Spirochaetes bacterium]|nr:sugar ABC transporter permease [Spirochaetota bacterium]